MSGYPLKDKVAELREALRELQQSDAEVRGLEQRLQECAANLPKAQDRSARAMRSVMTILEQMDCASTGNHGWQNRFATLLVRLNSAEST